MIEGRELVAEDVEEPTEVAPRKLRALFPCALFGCSGCLTVLLEDRAEPHVCPWCRGSGFYVATVAS